MTQMTWKQLQPILARKGLLSDKGRSRYATARRCPNCRATILTGIDWEQERFIPCREIAADINPISAAGEMVALALGRAVAAGRNTTLEQAGTESGRDGHTGARKPGAIGFAALRAGQVVGEHTLLFASGEEHIALTHRSFDRRVYATGAVRAALWALHQPPGLYGMKHVLNMA